MANSGRSRDGCTAPIHEWQPQRGTDSWFCTECGLVVFSTPFVKAKKPSGQGWMNKVMPLIARDGLTCFYCEHELLDPRREHFPEATWWPTLDHLLPRSAGGGNGLDNLVLACRGCNALKANHVKLLAEVISRQRRRIAQLEAGEQSAAAFILHLQWELFDAGLGEMPGRASIEKNTRKKTLRRPRPYLRDIGLLCEVGERTCAHLRAENDGAPHGRTAAVIKRFKACERPRMNTEHVHQGNNPRGVW